MAIEIGTVEVWSGVGWKVVCRNFLGVMEIFCLDLGVFVKTYQTVPLISLHLTKYKLYPKIILKNIFKIPNEWAFGYKRLGWGAV